MTTLQEAVVSSDDYSLMHRSSFGKGIQHNEKGRRPTGLNVDGGRTCPPGSDLNKRISRFPSGAMCFFVRRRGCDGRV